MSGRDSVERTGGVDRFCESSEGYYDLILMDIRMPVMDGLEAAKLIRASGRTDARTVPIVAMSANAFEEDVKKSLESGMNAHLAKPFQMEDLIRTMRRIIGRENRVWKRTGPEKQRRSNRACGHKNPAEGEEPPPDFCAPVTVTYNESDPYTFQTEHY